MTRTHVTQTLLRVGLFAFIILQMTCVSAPVRIFAQPPLPLAAHWNLGEAANGFGPEYQLKLISAGRHILPWIKMPGPELKENDSLWTSYYQGPLRRFAELKVPISLVGTQWEARLTTDAHYFKLPADENPNVINLDGTPKPEVSAFGPAKHWRDVGRLWTTSPLFRKVIAAYREPPMVLLVSNNEHTREWWVKVEEDQHYLKRFGRGRSDDFKRKAVGDGWIELYRALQAGMREGLAGTPWEQRVVFVGYDAFGPPHFARWPGWMEYSLYSQGRIDPKPLAWDGASPSFYVFNWNESTDYTVISPQVESMNWIFMLREAVRLNPKFWFEISTWDGHEPEMDNDKRKLYARRGQQFTPERYGGMVQFGMWLLKPRVVREFRGWQDTLAQAEPFFKPILDAVDRVHASSVLGRFWRDGELVVNPEGRHPYQSNVPAEYRNEPRWFLLSTSVDPPKPWRLETPLPVFALALVAGQAPSREWLVYAHAPLGAQRGVSITLPGYGDVKADVSVGGSFIVISEKTRESRPLLDAK